MSLTNFDLSDLYQKAFGYKTTAFDPKKGLGTAVGDKPSARTQTGALGSPYYSTDGLKTEYFMPVTLTYPQGTNGALVNWELPYPVISISSKKTIIETPLTERRGTVKELINIQDYEIAIKGFIIQVTNDFPESKVTTLRTIYEQNIPLSIKCPLTDIFLLRPDRSGSDQVIIRELKFPAIAGIKNVRPYELSLLSDEPFNLISIS